MPRNPAGLPPRVALKRGVPYYLQPVYTVGPDGRRRRRIQWHRLGDRWDGTALDAYQRLHSPSRPRTVAWLLDRFLEHAEAQVRAGERAPRTLADNQVEAAVLKRTFGAMGTDAVRPDHVARYLTLCREAGRGIRANREVSLLSSAYAWAMGQQLGVDRNPCYGVRRNRQRPRGRCPSVREVLLFARHYAPRWLRVFLLLKLLTGHRQADVRAFLRDLGGQLAGLDRDQLKDFLAGIVERINLDPESLNCRIHYGIRLSTGDFVASPRRTGENPGLRAVSAFRIRRRLRAA